MDTSARAPISKNAARCKSPRSFLAAQPRDDFLASSSVRMPSSIPSTLAAVTAVSRAFGRGVPVVTLHGEFLRSRITAGDFIRKCEHLVGR